MRIELRFPINALTFLLGFNLVIFIIAFLLRSNLQFDAGSLYILGGFDLSKVYSGQLWLLVTSNFLHIELLHFLFNFYALYVIGREVMYIYEGKVLFATYIIGGLFGMLLPAYIPVILGGISTQAGVSSLIFFNFLGAGFFSLGASGAIFALIGLLLTGAIRSNRKGGNFPISPREILPVAIVSLIFGFIPGSNINNAAHLFGLLSGMILGYVFEPSLLNIKSRVSLLMEKVFYRLSLGIFILSYIFLLINAYNLILR